MIVRPQNTRNTDQEKKVEQKLKELSSLLGFGGSEWEQEDLTRLILESAKDAISEIEDSNAKGLGYVGLTHFGNVLAKKASTFTHRRAQA